MPAAEPTTPPASGRLVAGVVALLALLGAAWTFASPIGSGPDDTFHLASIWCSPTAPASACDDLGFSFATGKTFVEVPAEIGPDSICYVYLVDDSASCQDGIETGTTVRTIANDGIYPPVHHALLGFAVGDDPVPSALRARLLAWALAIGLLAAGRWVLPARLRATYLLVLAVTAVPHGVFLWASTNPSGAVVAATSAAWCAVLGLLAADDRRSLVTSSAVLAVAAIVAAGSRADGGLYLSIALVSAGVLVWGRERAARRRLAAVGGVVALVALVSFVILTQRVQTVGGLVSSAEPPPFELPDGKLWYNLLEIPWFIVGNLGTAASGWLDVPMPPLVWFPTMLVFSALVFFGLGRIDRRKGLALACLLGGLLVVPYFLLFRSDNVVGVVVQPRYVLPLLPVFGFTVLHSRSADVIAGIRRPHLVGALGLLALAHAIALHTTIRRYVTGIDDVSPNLDAGRQWWWDIPLPPSVVWLAGTSAFTGLLAVLGAWILRPPPQAVAPSSEQECEPVREDSYA